MSDRGDFIMAIRTFSVEETSSFDVSVYGTSKYPWRTTSVGESFFVPRTELKREDYRPTPPENLKREGWKFVTSKFTTPDTNEVGVLVRRIS